MIVDTNQLKNARVGSMWVVGRAAGSTDLLRTNESVLLFAGLHTAIDWIKKNYPVPKRDCSSDERGKRGNFFNFTSYKQAMDAFQKNAKSLVKFTPADLRPTDFLEKGQYLEYDVTGDFIDMGRYVEGEPESMGALHDGLARTRRVKIVICITQVCHMSQQDINTRSIRLIRLVDALENAHVRTEINAVDSNGCNHTEILVKRFDESLVIEDIAVVTHSDFFRRLMFRCSEWSKTWHPGYGNAYILRESRNVIKSQLNDEISVYIDGSLAEKSVINKSFDKLEKVLEKELSGLQPELNLISLMGDGNVEVSRLDIPD